MLFDGGISLTWIIAAGSLLLLVLLVVSGRRTRSDERVAELALDVGQGPSPSPAEASPGGMRRDTLAETPLGRRVREEDKKLKLKDRIIQAGMYQRHATATFRVLRIITLVAPMVGGIAVATLGMIPLLYGLLLGVLVSLAGILVPSFWLDHVKRSRQKKIRRSLPDALDLVSVCLGAGMSLSAALSRVARELATAHPMLALELAIVERETQMGRSTGQAMREFAKRFDLEELRSLASVITQAEKFGSSVTKAMDVYADSLRLRRHQRAEELAQKAVVKIIFPTLFCIFPGIFIVVLGPAAIQIYQVLIKGVFQNTF